MPTPSSLKVNVHGSDRVTSPLSIVGMVLGFTMFFTAMSTFVKLSAGLGVPIFTIMFCRFLFGIIPVAFWLRTPKNIISGVLHNEWKALLTRTLMGIMAMWCVFTSFKLLPLAEATVLHFASPFFLCIISIFLLGEHVGKWRWSAIIVGFIGVIIVLDPSFSTDIYGQIIAICAAIIMSLNMAMVRSLKDAVSPAAMTIFLHVTGTLLLLPFAIYEGFIPTLEQWPLLIIAGISAGIGQIFLNQAYMKAPGAFVSSFTYIQIIFVTVVGYLVFGDVPTEHFILGASIIVGSGVVIAIREYLLNKKNMIKDMS